MPLSRLKGGGLKVVVHPVKDARFIVKCPLDDKLKYVKIAEDQQP